VGYVFKDEQGHVTVHAPHCNCGDRKGCPAKRPRVYLDTSPIVGVAKRDQRPNEQQRLRKLLRLRKEGQIELVTSPVAAEEIARYEGELSELQEDIYALLVDVSTVPERNTGSALTM
jgi:hypothetical protein